MVQTHLTPLALQTHLTPRPPLRCGEGEMVRTDTLTMVKVRAGARRYREACGMVRSATRARIEAWVAQFLTDVCEIQRSVTTAGALGEPVESWSVVASDVPCRMIGAGSASGTATRDVGAQEAMVEMYRLVLPLGTVVGVDTRVVVAGATYEVVRVQDGLTSAVDVQAWVVRVREAV
jgi:hypothetical protein